MIGNQGCSPEGGNPLYGSMDFVHWYKIGCTTLMAGDCPTFFPLPAITPGAEHYIQSHSSPMPDHVHKSGGPGGDQVQVGQWTDGKAGPEGHGTVGVWKVTPGTRSVLLDKGKTHASKDFYDPVKKRRILWVWGTVPSGLQTVPRVMTYHPGIQQIVYPPVEEMLQLRTGQIDEFRNRELETPVSLKVSGASDVQVTFSVPTKATTLSVAIGNGLFFTNFTPPSVTTATSSKVYTWEVSVGFGLLPRIRYFDSLPLLGDDKEITMRIFLDNTVAECYWQGGRVAMTVPTTEVTTASVASSNDSRVKVSAESFTMGDIHTDKADVLATPRPNYMQ